MKVVDEISNISRDLSDRPLRDAKVVRITISDD